MWSTFEFRAMGCDITLWLETSKDDAQKAFEEVVALFYVYEKTFSRFDPTSELSRINRHPEKWTMVSDVMWTVLRKAIHLAEETDGLFDPTILPAMDTIGYVCDFSQIGETYFTVEPFGLLDRATWKDICFDRVHHAVWLPWNLQIDLGGIVKGYTAQKAVECLSAYGPALVNAGGDVVAGDAPQYFKGWPVAISSPYTGKADKESILMVRLANSALTTSGRDRRNWVYGSKKVHHIIDPRTLEPAVTDALTVSVLDTDVCRAEAWATAMLVAGVDQGMDALEKRKLAGLFVDENLDQQLTSSMSNYIISAA